MLSLLAITLNIFEPLILPQRIKIAFYFRLHLMHDKYLTIGFPAKPGRVVYFTPVIDKKCQTKRQIKDKIKKFFWIFSFYDHRAISFVFTTLSLSLSHTHTHTHTLTYTIIIFCSLSSKSQNIKLIKTEKKTSLSMWPNPDGRINRKRKSWIIDQTAELIKNRTAEFDQTAEYWYTIVPTQYSNIAQDYPNRIFLP